MVKKIFSKKVAYELIQKGFNIVDMETNLKHKWLKVFVFEESQELLQELTKISKK